MEWSFVPDLIRLVSTPNPTSSSLSLNKIPAHILSLVTTEPLVPRKVSVAMDPVHGRRYLDLCWIDFPVHQNGRCDDYRGSIGRTSRRIGGANALSKRTKTALRSVGISTGQENHSAGRQDACRGSSLCRFEGKADQVGCKCLRQGTFLRRRRSHRERRRVCGCLLPHNRWVGRGPQGREAGF